ncbi:MAG: SURF1 family cytochrome oxidase biogenesis protein [Sphingomicrobium sp.]
MMLRRLPLIPTILVAAAVAAMIALGFWQIRRAHEKEALLARYAAARTLPAIAWPTAPIGEPLPLFRQASGTCLRVADYRTRPGQSVGGEPGFLIIADCVTGAEGPGMAVEMGWSKDPNAGRGWKGGAVSGTIAPDRDNRMRLVAAAPLQGLAASATPSTDSIPNNHRSYAVQWFLFALVALVIYGIAVRHRLAVPEKGES